jgi:glutathione peroxidase
MNLCEYTGNVILVVNVASRCGYTPQYAGLQRLYNKYKEDGLMVIGIPSRDFFQEYSAESKVAEFCSTEYGVEFPMFSTAKLRQKAHPIFKKTYCWSGKNQGGISKYLY